VAPRVGPVDQGEAQVGGEQDVDQVPEAAGAAGADAELSPDVAAGTVGPR
jgi:hypothetical protein